MTNAPSDRSFTEDVAALYESTFVPLIFQPYATDLAVRVLALHPSSVLEIACGTGVVTRALADTLPATCEITATDLSGAMVVFGESVGTARAVTWGQADATALPYDDQAFDVVVCQFGVMFFPDRLTAYREIRRVLRPGGTFLFNVWTSLERNEFASIVTEALRNRYPTNPPMFLARTPHGHGSPIEIESDLKTAGFSNWTLEQREDISTAASPNHAAIAYCQGTPLRHEIEAREPGGLERATSVAAAAIEAHYADQAIAGRISAIVVSAD